MLVFIGTGYLGSSFIKAFLKRDTGVIAWNRTYEKAIDLEKFGAKVCENIVDAVIESDRIHIALKDDRSVDEVLSVAIQYLKPSTTIFDHTTTSVMGVKNRTAYFDSIGINYMHAPVFMSPDNALNGTGKMLLSGNQDIINKWLPELSKMTGEVLNYGPEIGKAAAIKLIRNYYVIGMNAVLFEALNLAKGLNIEPDIIAGLFNNWNPGLVLPNRINKISNQDFDNVAWDLEMARKDVQLMLNESTNSGINPNILSIVAKIMDKHISNGNGDKDWTIISQL